MNALIPPFLKTAEKSFLKCWKEKTSFLSPPAPPPTSEGAPKRLPRKRKLSGRLPPTFHPVRLALVLLPNSGSFPSLVELSSLPSWWLRPAIPSLKCQSTSSKSLPPSSSLYLTIALKSLIVTVPSYLLLCPYNSALNLLLSEGHRLSFSEHWKPHKSPCCANFSSGLLTILVCPFLFYNRWHKLRTVLR